VLVSHIADYLVSEKKTFHITTVSVLTSLEENINYTVGWTGMGKALGTKKQILMKVRKNTQARKAWADVDTLIIKDASLLSAFLLDIMDFLGKEIRKDTHPFGGIQIILLGDIRGLPPQNAPAVCCPNCGQTHKLAHQTMPSALDVGGYINCSSELCNNVFVNPWILYPFESSIWESAEFYFFKLNERYGIENNFAKFLDALNGPLEGVDLKASLSLCDFDRYNSPVFLHLFRFLLCVQALMRRTKSTSSVCKRLKAILSNLKLRIQF
jgi:hypothetical protein